MNMKLDIDWTKTVVFCVVFVGVAVLTALGKVPAEYLKYLFVWLVPSPMQVKQEELEK